MLWPLRPPRVVHHMAALDDRRYPPNALEAVEACLQASADWVEVDVTALAHEDYLLVHDPLLEAETTGVGPVATCSPERVRGLRLVVGGRPTAYAPALLSDVVALFARQGGATRLQLDWKDAIPWTDDEPLRRLVRLIEPLGERVLVSAIADWQLRRLHRLAPKLALGFDVLFYLDRRPASETPQPGSYPQRVGAYGYWDDHPLANARIWSPADYLADRVQALIGLVPAARIFYLRHDLLTHSLDDGFDWVAALHAAGIAVDAWTLDIGAPGSEEVARRLLAAGVDQFTSNTPLALRRVLQA